MDATAPGTPAAVGVPDIDIANLQWMRPYEDYLANVMYYANDDPHAEHGPEPEYSNDLPTDEEEELNREARGEADWFG